MELLCLLCQGNAGESREVNKMVMYINRSERNTDFWAASTPKEVGPGTYALPITSARAASVPFSVGTLRSSSHLILNEGKPGPGAYDPNTRRSSSPNKIGSSSFISKQPRLAPNAPGSSVFCFPSSFKNPGPGSYEVRGKHHKIKNKKPHVRTVVVYPTGASIPSSDKPISAQAGEVTQEVSPNTYTPQDSLTYKKAPTADFGRSKYKRRLFEPTIGHDNTLPAYDVPGPGAYTAAEISSKLKGTSAFVSKSIKPSQAKVPAEKLTPGPGAYEAAYGLSDKIPYNYNPIFERSIPRKDDWRNDYEAPYTAPFRTDVPPVGLYNPGTDQESIKRKILTGDAEARKKQHGFGSTQGREGLLKETSPGPGHYKPGLAEVPLTAYKRPIGGMSPRRHEFDVIKEVPGPGTYDIKKVRPVYSRHSVFKSITKRFNKPKTAGPEASLAPDEWKPHTNRSVDFGYYSEQPSFDARSPRKNEQFHSPHQGPGPGKYSAPQIHQGGAKFDHAQRFDTFGTYRQKPGTSSEVGPGAYALEEGFVKKSYNSVIESSNA